MLSIIVFIRDLYLRNRKEALICSDLVHSVERGLEAKVIFTIEMKKGKCLNYETEIATNHRYYSSNSVS